MNNLFLKTIKLILVISMCILVSCDEDEIMNNSPIADAGPDIEVPSLSTVTLDGTGSSDPDGDVLTYDWTIVSVPTNAQFAFSNATQVQALLSVRTVGEYVFTLTVNDGTSSSVDEMIVTVLPESGSGGSALIIDSDINEDTIWEDVFDDPNLPDYKITTSIDINAFLTIEEGVKIVIDEDVIISVNSNGALDAQGTASDSIVFTSSDVQAGLRWKGLYVNSSDVRNSLDHVRFSWAGNSEIGFGPLNSGAVVGLGVDDNGKMSITNSTFANNLGYSAYFDDGEGELEDFANNAFQNYVVAIGLPANEVDALDGQTTFSNGTEADVQIFTTTYAASNSSTWPALNNASYFVAGNIRISGALAIEAGAVFEMDEDVFWTIDGSIDVNGTMENHVVFASANEEAQFNWAGIFIESASSLNSFDFAEILDAGGAVAGYGPINGTQVKAAVGVDYEQNKVSITNSIISRSEGYGLYVERGGEVENFANNSFIDNETGVGLPANEVDALDEASSFSSTGGVDVEITSSTYAQSKSAVWPALNDASYLVSGNLAIAGDLAIDAGAVFEMDEDVFWTVTGSLDVNGTSADYVVFTTSNVAVELNWGGIKFESRSDLNSIDYAEIRWGGGATSGYGPINSPQVKAAVGVDQSDDQLIITNSIITDSEGYGVFSLGDTNDIEATEEGNTFLNNPMGNSYIQ